jgi:penicillin-binding protein 1C
MRNGDAPGTGDVTGAAARVVSRVCRDPQATTQNTSNSKAKLMTDARRIQSLPSRSIPSQARRLIVYATRIACCASLFALRPIVPAQLAENAPALELRDRYERRLGTIYERDEHHAVNVPLARISRHFIAAILATEDHRFFEHGAIDAPALARAAANALRKHERLGGASTISMQLARLLTPMPATFLGKIQETILAQRLENGLSKARILQAYCNRLPMGSNLYGVEAAARTYFGLSAFDLDLAQASLLAALPNDPTRLDPYRRWDALKRRQRLVLERMRAERFITEETARQTYGEPLTLMPQAPGIVAAPHFLFWSAGHAPPEQTLMSTTIDLRLQRFVQEQVRNVVQSLQANNVHDAAALVVDNRNRQILAYVGSPDYFSDDILGRNDGVQALRQPGSALKPFLYELALERRAIAPATILQDVPTAYALPGARIYRPQDYSGRYQGPVRVRIALADSLNVPAVRVLERVGVGTFLDRLRALGFSHLRKPADYYGLGLTLGGGEVTLYELTRAYVSLARNGRRTRLISTLDDAPTPKREPGGGDAAWNLITDMLADAHARAGSFGVNSVLRLPFAAAVKTGTSSDYRDTWTIGFTRDYTVGVWVGNFDGTPMRNVSGVSGAGPLWNRIMLHLHEQREPALFDPPLGYVRRAICANTGTAPSGACPAVVMEYLRPEDLSAYRRAKSPNTTITSGIIFPREGDRFILYPETNGAQQLRFRFAVPTGALHVTLDNRPFTATEGDYLWPLAFGAHTLRLHAASKESAVRFSVVNPPPQRRQRGFTQAF